jgi:hypothetical protein
MEIAFDGDGFDGWVCGAFAGGISVNSVKYRIIFVV